MNVVYGRSVKGTGKLNEDVFGHTGNLAWVIDGATDVFRPERNDVLWYVSRLSDAIRREAENDPDGNPSGILRASIASIRRNALTVMDGAFHMPEYMLPTYAISMVKETPDGFDYLLLGDAEILYRDDGNADMPIAPWNILSDDRIDPFRRRNQELISALPEGPEREAEVCEIYRETRRKANVPDGYPIGSTDQDCVRSAMTGHVSFENGGKILLYTGGLRDYDMIRDGDLLLYNGWVADETLSAFRRKEIQAHDGCDDMTTLLIRIKHT